ncbi:MAG: DUF1232 domain-containing protein [Gorillibacterium sp.]|nr:DUF1232 domain-containing protein [Gorillibacterium sp.]
MSIENQDDDTKLGRNESQNDEDYVRNNFWAKVKRYSTKIPFLKDAVAIYYCAIDPKTPKWAKVIAFGGLAYFILPVDVIPDFLIIAGWTDDAAILAAALKTISSHVKDEHKDKASLWMSRKKGFVNDTKIVHNLK